MKQNQLPLSAEPNFEQRVAEAYQVMLRDSHMVEAAVEYVARQPDGLVALTKMVTADYKPNTVAAAEAFRTLVEAAIRDTAERTVRVTDTRRKMEK